MSVEQTPEYVEIGEYCGDDMSRYTMSWKSIVDTGMLLPGAKLYAQVQDVEAWQAAVEKATSNPVVEQTPAPEIPADEEPIQSTVMDKDRLDRAT